MKRTDTSGMETQQHRRARWAVWMPCGLLAILLLFDGFAQTQKVSGSEAQAPQIKVSNRDGYVGSASCSRCHLGIYKQFSRTSMGRSMSRITPELLQTFPTSADVYDAKL